ncbi:MAG TPA: antitoxin family protein [Pyrinomonadaceae bacterium]|nr:antitoxin family protein [Pyrinomonadaceae bacterium]
MSREVKAIFRNGQVKPLEPLDLPEDSHLKIIIEETNGERRLGNQAEADDPIARIYEIAEDIGPADLATNLDHYLYGTPKVG